MPAALFACVQCLIVGPSEFHDALPDHFVWQIQFAAPIKQAHRLAVSSYHDVSRRVSELRRAVRPPAIPRLVVAVVVDPVKFSFRERLPSHVGNERRKSIAAHPPFADRDAASTVAVVVFETWISASKNHVPPASHFISTGDGVVSHNYRLIARNKPIPLVAAATCGLQTNETCSKHNDFCSTRASAKPSRFARQTVRLSLGNGEASELPLGQIKWLYHVRHHPLLMTL